MKENSGYHQHPGGAKRFLYTGAKKETEEDDQWSFAPKHQPEVKPSLPVDLNNVWSIQKNVSLGGLKPLGSERVSQSTTKGYYSRHGGMKETGKLQKPPEKSEASTTWAPAQGTSFSNSYNSNNAGPSDGSSIGYSSLGHSHRADFSPRLYELDHKRRPLDENDF